MDKKKYVAYVKSDIDKGECTVKIAIKDCKFEKRQSFKCTFTSVFSTLLTCCIYLIESNGVYIQYSSYYSQLPCQGMAEARALYLLLLWLEQNLDYRSIILIYTENKKIASRYNQEGSGYSGDRVQVIINKLRQKHLLFFQYGKDSGEPKLYDMTKEEFQNEQKRTNEKWNDANDSKVK